MVTDARDQEFAQIRKAIIAWATATDSIEAVALVGSWARGQARMDSDLDVVVLTESDHFVDRVDWIKELCGEHAVLARTADWGAITERRIELVTGFEIEFGFGRPTWASVSPLDPGTRRVIADGCISWYDPTGLLQQLIDAVAK